jgi:hypothetical protein
LTATALKGGDGTVPVRHWQITSAPVGGVTFPLASATGTTAVLNGVIPERSHTVDAPTLASFLAEHLARSKDVLLDLAVKIRTAGSPEPTVRGSE